MIWRVAQAIIGATHPSLNPALSGTGHQRVHERTPADRAPRELRGFSQILANRIGRFRQGCDRPYINQQLTKLARFLLRCWQAQYRADNTGNDTMTYQATTLRNAFVAVAFTFLASAVFMAGAVGPAIA